MKKFFSVAIIPALVMASTCAFAVREGETSTVTFKGSIKENTCVLTKASAAQVVILGDVESSVLASANSASQPTNFTISLDECDSANASITFSGTTATDEVLSITGKESVASGVGIQILNSSTYLPVKVDGSAPAATMEVGADKANEFNFAARYFALGDNISAGEANATAQFTVKYQ
ncbi:type 1 fimbrial protein [Klebsiella sp. RHBSTW-00484]|uniref:fimbrial protein n=1 Tax=unclassified Klebsiella TaxID=2608929 RepID=UPI0015E53828|nr:MULTISPECIES: fimbrial protein [unclassified Klebsiella]MBA7843253.1 type 1 fimbrial protein [Klebsiella sp. RHBSTW-00465]QLO38625.1 type 1 fimbrial protein [Klebsiella sp. RHBSTW-00484]QLT78145.1 type 1 fimbrial protein [Klebsiella sp. RHBSTW-00464]